MKKYAITFLLSGTTTFCYWRAGGSAYDVATYVAVGTATLLVSLQRFISFLRTV